jgi:hypothetical protein
MARSCRSRSYPGTIAEIKAGLPRGSCPSLKVFRPAPPRDPEKTTVCHCTDCQVGTGSAFRVNVPVPGATFRITGQPATYLKTTAESGNPAGVLSACSCSCRTRYRPNRSWSLWPTQRRIQASSHWHRPAPAARRIWLASCSSKWPGSAKCRLSVPIRRNLTSGHLWVVLNFWRFHPVPSINSRATLNPRRGEQIAFGVIGMVAVTLRCTHAPPL